MNAGQTAKAGTRLIIRQGAPLLLTNACKMSPAIRLRKVLQLGSNPRQRADSRLHWGGNENHALIRGGENYSAINIGVS
jgi:hypothetical protein